MRCIEYGHYCHLEMPVRISRPSSDIDWRQLCFEVVYTVSDSI